MAESDADQPAAGAVTTEEADRLSEQFRPSWEDDPPTIPREQPAPAPTPEAKPKVMGPAPVTVSRAPVVAVTAMKASPPREGVGSKITPDETPIALRSPKQATLLGISPSPTAKGAPTARGHATDDLDWEVPAGAVPAADEPPVQVDVEELPPDSKPSGIGQTYKPKDEGAPPVVLGPDIEVAEVGTQAKLEAEHRARGAPTIARLKAIDIPAATLASAPIEPLAPRPRRYGGVVVLGLVVLLGGAAGAFLLKRGARDPAAPGPSSTVPAAVTADTAAPSPPGLSAAEPAAAPAPSPTEEPAVSVVPAEGAPPEPAQRTEEPPGKPTAKPPAAKPSPVKAPPAAKPAAKPVAAQPKPASRAGASSPKWPSGSKGVIVRDNPF